MSQDFELTDLNDDILYIITKTRVGYIKERMLLIFRLRGVNTLFYVKCSNIIRQYYTNIATIDNNVLKVCNHLTRLNLYNCKTITDDALILMTNLNSLCLCKTGNNITDHGLKSLTNLVNLDLTKNRYITNLSLLRLKNLTIFGPLALILFFLWCEEFIVV